MSRPKSAAVKDIDIDIGKGYIDPPLYTVDCTYSNYTAVTRCVDSNRRTLLTPAM